MSSKHDIGKILFLDVETVPLYAEYKEMPARWRSLWDRKAESLGRWDPESLTSQELYQRAGIYAEFGKIVCISVGHFRSKGSEKVFRIKSFYGQSEQEILEPFLELLTSTFPKKFSALCAHNGKEFDFPYICRRSLANRFALPKALQIHGKKPWELHHLIDTMHLWTFGDYKHFASLDLMAAVFNIPTPKNDITGADVAGVYYQNQDLNRIKTYCEKDVQTLAAVYSALQGFSFDFVDHNVEHVD